ncbi:hypothetical protein Acr_28g0001760 [Actinidia rufa]|uniref:Uncharacterized protein n=1 Tax=Actinidia rufa TaxID=165716 RepID=A0A7J0H940_9ERIC|nr:hypothetical protein Acr_28g0001760 [Actinidia rufa]
MAKKQTSTSSKGACDKIYKAIRRISHCPRSSKPFTAPGSLPLSPELKKTTTEPISTEFPVHFNHPVSATPMQQKEQTVKTHIASRTESLSPVIVPKVASKTKQVKPRAERAAPAQEGVSRDEIASMIKLVISLIVQRLSSEQHRVLEVAEGASPSNEGFRGHGISRGDI